MKRYDIKIIHNGTEEICMIFSTSYLSPLKFLSNIEKDLIDLSCANMEVIFDFFTSNGNAAERYAKAYFDGVNIVRDSFKYLRLGKDDNLRKISAQYYKDEKEKVDFSFVNSIQKKMIIKGIAI